MSSTHHLYWLHALSPVRVGVEEGLSAINLPTMREVHTGHPLVPGSSLKGVLRAEMDKDNAEKIFGPDRLNAGDYRGAVAVTDAQLVALPVRSLRGTWAWVCSPLSLARLNRVRTEVGPKLSLKVPSLPAGATPLVCDGSALLGKNGKVYLEEYELSAGPDQGLTTLATTVASEIWKEQDQQKFFVERLLLVEDDLLNALCQTSLELRTRVAIDPEKGTAAASGPWTEEAMPAESLLAGLLIGRSTKGQTAELGLRELISALPSTSNGPGAKAPFRLHVGGHTGVGFGRVNLHLVEGQ